MYYELISNDHHNNNCALFKCWDREKNYFKKVLDLTNLNNMPKSIFTEIMSLNYLGRKEILNKLETVDNLTSRMISKSIHYEMDLISHV